MNNTNTLTIQSILGWSEADVEKINFTLEEYGIDRDDLTSEIFDYGYDCKSIYKINTWLNTLYMLASDKIKNILSEAYPVYEAELNDYIPTVYINSIGTKIEGPFGYYRFEEIKENADIQRELMNYVIKESNKLVKEVE